MVQGTGSGVGKSILCAALCRIFFQDGVRVAPFKTQNMSLNSCVTRDGLEMARSQVVQAEAACIEPAVEMNPILLKPNSDTGCQVVLNGRVIGDYSAVDYGRYQRELWTSVVESYRSLSSRYDVIVIEGAGSPAEVNLKDRDIVNMRTARMADAPVLLVADIDRGGVFASLVGTVELLEPPERKRIKGFIINKFRGDLSLLAPGLDFLAARTGTPVLGVVPYYRDVHIQEEDGMALGEQGARARTGTTGPSIKQRHDIDIAVVHLPHIANFTDFAPLIAESGVQVRYISSPAEVDGADALILPGSKSTIADLHWLRSSGLERAIRDYGADQGMVVGICGGYQMLGLKITDSLGVDGSPSIAEGIGLLPIETEMEPLKQTLQVVARPLASSFWEAAHEVTGYEIHMGRTDRHSGVKAAFRIETGEGECREDGAIAPGSRVWGSYLHGLFESDGFRKSFLDGMRRRKGLEESAAASYDRLKQEGYDRLADIVRQSLDMDKIYELIR